MEKITSAHIRAALKEKFPVKSHALLFEVGNSTGYEQRRWLDAVAMGLWPSHGHEIDGIEIKISRSDYKRELEDHSKAGIIHQYCHRFWIACPKDMLNKNELPAGWGLMEFDQEKLSLRVKVKPENRNPVAPTSGFVAAMLRRAAESYHQDVDQLLGTKYRAQETEIRNRLQSDFDRRVSSHKEEHAEFLQKLKQIQAATGIDLTKWSASEDQIAAIKFAQKHIKKYGGVKQLKDQLVKLAAGIDEFFGIETEVKVD